MSHELAAGELGAVLMIMFVETEGKMNIKSSLPNWWLLLMGPDKNIHLGNNKKVRYRKLERKKQCNVIQKTVNGLCL